MLWKYFIQKLLLKIVINTKKLINFSCLVGKCEYLTQAQACYQIVYASKPKFFQFMGIYKLSIWVTTVTFDYIILR